MSQVTPAGSPDPQQPATSSPGRGAAGPGTLRPGPVGSGPAGPAHAGPTHAGPAHAGPGSDGRSTRWDDHRLARRADLVRAARRCVHRSGPDVSMEEIAAEAGTSKSIVYRYFTDKTALQVAVGELVVSQIHAALDEAVSTASTPREGLRSMIEVYLEMVAGSPNVYWFVTRPTSEAASAPLGHFLDAVAGLIARPLVAALTARGRSSARPPVHPDLWATGAVGFVRGAGEWWLKHGDEPDAPGLPELAERVTAWLWAGPVGALTGGHRTDPVPSPDLPAQAGTTHDLDEETS